MARLAVDVGRTLKAKTVPETDLDCGVGKKPVLLIIVISIFYRRDGSGLFVGTGLIYIKLIGICRAIERYGGIEFHRTVDGTCAATGIGVFLAGLNAHTDFDTAVPQLVGGVDTSRIVLAVVAYDYTLGILIHERRVNRQVFGTSLKGEHMLLCERMIHGDFVIPVGVASEVGLSRLDDIKILVS